MGIFDDFSVHFRLIIPSLFPISQRLCRRDVCRKARKLLAQHRWTERNPGYFRGWYPYVKKWREARKNAPRPMIQDKIPLLRPLFKMTLLIPGGIGREMIQDEILLERIDRTTFIATGPGG
jgi:hypothetical protein